ncbi:hypothetical protein BGZ46_010094 [Entomortierella lignicola]|nr:hypothetical protein BGZ46_010094 [Entomortierella lignicola]
MEKEKSFWYHMKKRVKGVFVNSSHSEKGSTTLQPDSDPRQEPELQYRTSFNTSTISFIAQDLAERDGSSRKGKLRSDLEQTGTVPLDMNPNTGVVYGYPNSAINYNSYGCFFDEFGFCSQHRNQSNLCNPTLNHNDWDYKVESFLEDPVQFKKLYLDDYDKDIAITTNDSHNSNSNDGDNDDRDYHTQSRRVNEKHVASTARNWSNDYFDIHTTYKDSMASLHFSLCSDIHQRLLGHRHEIRRLQGQVYQNIGELPPVLSNVVHEQLMPKMIFDLEAQRVCCLEIGRTLRTELSGSLLLLETRPDPSEEIWKSTVGLDNEQDDENCNNFSNIGDNRIGQGIGDMEDDSWMCFGWSATERPFANWKEARMARKQFQGLMKDEANEVDAEEKYNDIDGNFEQESHRDDPYRKLGCFHSNIPIHGRGNNILIPMENDGVINEGSTTAPKMDISVEGNVNISSTFNHWKIPNGPNIISTIPPNLKEMDKDDCIDGNETECKCEGHSAIASSQPQSIVVKNTRNFYRGGVHYHYDTMPPPCTHDKSVHTDKDADVDSHGPQIKSSCKSSRNHCSKCFRTCRTSKPSKHHFTTREQYRDEQKEQQQRQQEQQQQNCSESGTRDNVNRHNNIAINPESIQPTGNYTVEASHRPSPSLQEILPKRQFEGSQRLARHTKTFDWRVLFKDQHQGQKIQEERDISNNHNTCLDRNLRHQDKFNVEDQDWFRDLHVRESTLILEGRRNEAVSLRRMRNKLKTCLRSQSWPERKDGTGRSKNSHACIHSSSRGRVHMHDRQGSRKKHISRGKRHALNMQNRYIDSLRPRTRHIITKIM